MFWLEWNYIHCHRGRCPLVLETFNNKNLIVIACCRWWLVAGWYGCDANANGWMLIRLHHHWPYHHPWYNIDLSHFYYYLIGAVFLLLNAPGLANYNIQLQYGHTALYYPSIRWNDQLFIWQTNEQTNEHTGSYTHAHHWLFNQATRLF